MEQIQANPKLKVGKSVTNMNNKFSRETSVSVNHRGGSVHCVDFTYPRIGLPPRWNSTVVSIKGEIKDGGTIELKSTLDEKTKYSN